MSKRKPNIIQQQQDEHNLTLWLDVCADIEDFNGHFAQFPLLPGVTQVDWAVYYAKQYLSTPSQFQGMEVIKFQEPIFQNSIVKLTLSWHSDKQKLYFSYTSGQDDDVIKTHSSGRILLS